MKKFNKVLSLLMAFAMVLTMLPASALAVESENSGVTIEPLDPSDVTADLFPGTVKVDESSVLENYADTDIVRVMIVLDDAPAIELMHSVEDSLSDGSPVAERREELISVQHTIADTISAALGSTLDVRTNLTLVANIISANVQYGQIDIIAGVNGVKDVYLAPMYAPMEVVPSNIISQEMTGASTVQNSGYTGAGTRVAIIDSGTDYDHQSFSGEAFEYALAELAELNGMSYDEYVETLDLLTVEDIADVLDQLNAYTYSEGTLTAEDLYRSTKLPFNYNYAERNLVTDHSSNLNEHGSHVAGITTANRYIDCTKVYDFSADGAFDTKDIHAVMNFVMGGDAIHNADYADLSGNGSITTYDVHLLLDALKAQQANGTHFISAYDSVRVTGTAPDAQLLTFNVFGSGGGTYADDYMSAVEDAIVLGCDVVNLSLGSIYSGFTYHGTAWIDEIMGNLAHTGVVMSVAAGNSGHWAEMSYTGIGLNYTDEASTSTVSEPSTYPNAFSVASADNVSSISNLEIAFKGADGANLPIAPFEVFVDNYTRSDWSILDEIDPNFAASEYELVFLGDPTGLLTGTEQTDMTIYGGEGSFDGVDVAGKIVLIARGDGVYFSDKYANAIAAGAAAIIFYSNDEEQLNILVDFCDPAYPLSTITMDEAKLLLQRFSLNKDGQYAGTLSVKKAMSVDFGEDVQYPTMSYFSSWGTTSALTIKPEITAPGGGIYSVNGLGENGDAYETMSGTSMATPHITGLVALLNQYFNETGVLEETGLSPRVLAHSLLMSTAAPLIDELSGVEYSVRQQGAGLANVRNAVLSNAYITVAGQTDGKVKAELGDGRQDRVIEFSITNFGDKDLTYDLSSSILTTDTYIDQYGLTYSDYTMTELGAEVTFSADTVTVPAGESVSVTATISVPAEVAAEMAALGYTNGFFLEGFLYINSVADAEGFMDASHSIPLLGWYGNWSDVPMYDSGDVMSLVFGPIERLPHIGSLTKNFLAWNITGDDEGMLYTGNIYGGITDDGYIIGDKRYIPARNAFSSLPTASWQVYGLFPTLIRNAGDFKFDVVDAETGEVYYSEDFEQWNDTLVGSFYYAGGGQWYDTTGENGIAPEDWYFTDKNGQPLADGTVVDIILTCVPEYYVREDGTVDWDNIELGEGVSMSYTFTIDNTAPDLVDAAESLNYDAKTHTLSFEVQDDNYIAAVVLLNGNASTALDYFYPDMDEDQRGKSVEGRFDLSKYDGQKVAVVICDYAGNETYYALNLNGEGESYGQFLGFQYDVTGYGINNWVAFDSDVSKNEEPIFSTTTSFLCAEYVNGYIYTQDDAGKLYGIRYEDVLANSVDLETCYITTLKNLYQDLAYNYADGQLYGCYIYESEEGFPTTCINTININGAYSYEDDYGDLIEFAPFEEVDFDTIDGLYALAMAASDDALYLLGPTAEEERVEGEPDEYGDPTYKWVTIFDDTAHLYSVTQELIDNGRGPYWRISKTDLGDTDLTMDMLQSMTWDHNTETLYWARFAVKGLDPVSELVKFTILENDTEEDEEDGSSNGGFDFDQEEEETPAEKLFTTEVIGPLTSETCALMAPLGAEAAAKPEHALVPEYDDEEIAVPVLSLHNMNLSSGQFATLTYTCDPWYSNYKDVVWYSSNEAVATVDQNGVVTAIASGVCEITIASVKDPTLKDTCAVSVTTLSLEIEGIVSTMGSGLSNVGNSHLYTYTLENGKPTLTHGDSITAPAEFTGFGLNIASSVYGRDNSIWACEWGNAGMIYQIDPVTGIIRDVIQPIDGDVMFGLSYSEKTGMFTGIMNYYMYVDQPLTHEAEKEIIGSYDEEENAFIWHRVNLAEELAASNDGFFTGEAGDGSIVDIVFCGITDIDNTEGTRYEVMTSPLGGYAQANYIPDTTHVLMDNVGRLWYIDEITNMSGSVSEWSEEYWLESDPETSVYPYSYGENLSGVFSTVYEVDEDTKLYNVFVIREIEETPLTDMFRAGTMPRATYHFSDLHYAGKTSDGAPVFYMSLYDYWNSGTQNVLYLYVGSTSTPVYSYDWGYPELLYTLKSDGILFELGGMGFGNVIATILSATSAAELEDMLPEIVFYEEVPDYYTALNAEFFVGCYHVEPPVVTPYLPSKSDPSYTVTCVNRLA